MPGVSKEVSEIYFMYGMYNKPPMTIDLHPALCLTFIEVWSIWLSFYTGLVFNYFAGRHGVCIFYQKCRCHS